MCNLPARSLSSTRIPPSPWPPASLPFSESSLVGVFIRMALGLAVPVFYFTTFLFTSFSFVNAQNISTSMTVPPLQWLNLSGLLRGPGPPPLKDAAIGYDETRYVGSLPSYPLQTFRRIQSFYHHFRRSIHRWFRTGTNISVRRYLLPRSSSS